MLRCFLDGTDLSRTQIERIAFLVEHHHTFSGVDGLDWQILLEADFLANATENGWSEQKVRHFLGTICKTESGARLIRTVMLPREG